MPRPAILRDKAILTGGLPIRLPGFLTVLVIPLCVGCSYSMPLGGASVGRGGPVGKGVLEFGASAGSFPELSGTVPEVADSSGYVVNPVPTRDALGSGGRTFDLVGVVLGLGDRADVGFSLSRGLHGTVRLKDGGVWSVSTSPSAFWYRSEDVVAKASVTNLGLFGVLAVDPWPGGRSLSEAYVAAGINRYRASLTTNAEAATHRDDAYSLAAGVRLGGDWPTQEYGDLGFSLGAEVGRARIQQRDGRIDWAPIGRMYLSLRFPPQGG